jgi:pyruvate-formate lyase-activating enzyme
MRPAFRIFLEHLGQLRMQMEAHVVDALEQDWKAPDWDVYVEVNRARVEERPPSVSRDQLQTHYRAMLRALVLPYRRNVPQQALTIIDEAAQVLHPEDNLLQSARRRHRAVTQEQQPRPDTAEKVAQPAPEPAPPKDAQGTVEAAESPAPETEMAFPVANVPVQPPQEDEFDSPWLK